MTTYFCNALPNALLPATGGQMMIKGITINEVVHLVSEMDKEQEYDNWTPPRKLREGVVCAIGHETTAALFDRLLSEEVGATFYGQSIGLGIAADPDRKAIPTLEIGDMLICGLFSPNRRLPAGEQWTEADVLANPVKWVVCAVVE